MSRSPKTQCNLKNKPFLLMSPGDTKIEENEIWDTKTKN